MKILIDLQELKNTLSTVMLAIPNHNVDPALENIKVEIKEKKMTMTTFNNELAITKELDIISGDEGKFLIPAKLFFEIVKKSECDKIELEIDPKFLINITAGHSDYTLIGMESEKYPHLPMLNPKNIDTISINQKDFYEMATQVMFAVSNNDDKPIYKGILFEHIDKKLILVAVDGFRLAMCKRNTNIEKNIRIIVPANTVNELIKLIRPTNEEEKEMEIKISGQYMLIETDKTTIISRLIIGDFIDYNEAIKGETIHSLTVNRQALIMSIERTSLLISDRIKNPLKIEFEKDLIKLSCKTTMGKASDKCIAKSNGETVIMGFNNKFLTDALRNTDSDEIKIEICGALAPLKILPLEGDSFLFIVLPMKIQ